MNETMPDSCSQDFITLFIKVKVRLFNKEGLEIGALLLVFSRD